MSIYLQFCRAISLSVLVTACSDDIDSPAMPEAEIAEPALLETYHFSDEDIVPANIAFDPIERNFYAASRRDGLILKISANGTESVFRQDDGRTPAKPGAIESGIGGIAVDAEARVLWACANNVDNIDNRM